ncbi:MAG: hypothetical protein HFF90_08380 [Oscillibacter sp.]|nr:hypothetical protein [Oscillibacter sp.]
MPELLEHKREIMIAAALLAVCLLLSALIITVLILRRSSEPEPEEARAPSLYQGMPLLVTREQVEQLSYTDSTLGTLTWVISDQRLEELNWVLLEYDISTPEQISQFLAQVTVETVAGRELTELGDNAYFQRYGYSFGTRGAGYLHLTHAYGQMAFATWLMKKYVPELSGTPYVNPGNHSRDEVASAYYKALQTAANLGLDVSEYSRVVYDGQDPKTAAFPTGADYIAEHYAWESAAYYWQAAGIQDAFSPTPGLENTDLASQRVGGGNWQSRREAYAAFYPVFSALP